MRLSDYTSLFELFTAFNFASIISNDFNDTLNKKITYPFYVIEKEFDNIRSKIGVIKTSISSLKKIEVKIDIVDDGSGTTIKTAENKLELNKTLTEYEIEFDSIKNSVSNALKIRGLSLTSFPVISMFSGLYSILVLFLCKFYDNRLQDSSFIDTLYFLNIICLIFITFSILKERLELKFGLFKLSHLSSIIFFCILIFLSLVIYQIDWKYFDITYDYKPNWHIKIIIVLTIIIPILHFVIMFVLALYNTRISVKRYMGILSTFETRLENFNTTEVNKSANFIEMVRDFSKSSAKI